MPILDWKDSVLDQKLITEILGAQFIPWRLTPLEALNQSFWDSSSLN